MLLHHALQCTVIIDFLMVAIDDDFLPIFLGFVIFLSKSLNEFYLFTTLLDTECYPWSAICELYGLRWQGEIDYRHIKTTLEMDEFDVKSGAMFQKELAAGLLTYNLICAYMVKAALKAGLVPTDLSFSRCARRCNCSAP